MARQRTERGIPGEGYVVATARGPFYRVPLPRTAGGGRTVYRARKLPATWAKLSRADQAAWKRNARAEILAAFAAARAPAEPVETVAAYLTRWLAETAPDLAPNTVANRRRAIERHIIPAFGERPLAELRAREIGAWLRGLPLAPSTVASIRSILSAAFNDAIRDEAIDRNPTHLARAPRQIAIERPILSIEQLRRLRDAAASERLGALLLLAGALGLRRGELLGLRWADVDLDAATLRVAVQRQYEVGRGMVERAPKAESARAIALPPLVVGALREHRDRQRWERQTLGYQDHGLVFANTRGRPHWTDYTSDLLRRVVARANDGVEPAERLPPLRLHDLRGSAASILFALGVPLPSVMAILGHRTASMTLEHYARALRVSLADAATALEAALAGR